MIIGTLISTVGLIAAATLILSDGRLLQVSGLVVLAVLVLTFVVSDWFQAHSNEKHVERHPHLLKNEMIGETVRVDGDFETANGGTRGVVILRGERWKARCLGDHVPKKGDALTVEARQGLTLCVRPQDRRE